MMFIRSHSPSISLILVFPTLSLSFYVYQILFPSLLSQSLLFFLSPSLSPLSLTLSLSLYIYLYICVCVYLSFSFSLSLSPYLKHTLFIYLYHLEKYNSFFLFLSSRFFSYLTRSTASSTCQSLSPSNALSFISFQILFLNNNNNSHLHNFCTNKVPLTTFYLPFPNRPKALINKRQQRFPSLFTFF